MKIKLVRRALLGKTELFAILILSFIGLLLRLYQLGSDGFWFDEIGVGMAIRSSTIATLVENVRYHVMAMPLDYITGWLFTRFCQEEACLRFPAAIWGALTIPLSYYLFKHLVDFKVAVMGAWLLALTPLHIYYSQELRFYASLVFFYVLSTFLLLRALEQSVFRRWLVFTLVAIVGSYFHLYVFLSFLNGGFWTIFAGNRFSDSKKAMSGLLASFLVTSLIILPGYLFFKASPNYSMFSFAEAIVNTMIGFGWLPINLFPLHLGMIWYPLFLFFQLVGCWALFKSRNWVVISWIFSSLLQVGIIFFVNAITQYALRGRQLLIIMPSLCLVAAQGIIEVYSLAENAFQLQNIKVGKHQKLHKRIFRLIVLFIGIIIIMFSLQDYYHLEKSRRREISIAVIQHWKPGEEIWLTPAWEEAFYGYYLNLLGYPKVEQALVGTESIQILKAESLPICWITDQTVTAEEREILIKAGLQIVPMLVDSIPDTQTLWCR